MLLKYKCGDSVHSTLGKYPLSTQALRQKYSPFQFMGFGSQGLRVGEKGMQLHSQSLAHAFNFPGVWNISQHDLFEVASCPC